MITRQDYDIPMIHQFYATVVFDEDDLRSFQWMTGPTQYSSNFREFGSILGYGFDGAEVAVGRRMHQVGVDPNKRRLAPLYGSDGVPGQSKNLKKIYNILRSEDVV